MKDLLSEGSPYRDIVIDDDQERAITLHDMLCDDIPCSVLGTSGAQPRTRKLAEGRYLCQTVRSGLQCLDCTLEMATELDMVSVSPRCIRVSSLFEGVSNWQVEGRRYSHSAPGIPQIAALGQDTPITTHDHRGQRYRMAGLLITPSFFECGSEDLQSGLHGLAALLDPGVHHRTFPTAQGLRALLERLHGVPFRGALGDLYRESLALGIVVELAAALGEPAPKPVFVSKRATQIAAEARERIDAAPQAVPSAAVLAHALGTNETTLRRAFKAAHGMRLFDYVLERRLRDARDLLRDTALPIGEIAWRAGYSDPANFTHAYRRRYGCAPRAERGGGRS